MKWKKLLIASGVLLSDVIALPVWFLCLSYCVAAIPVNSSYTPTVKGITIFVHTNGFHTDITVPVYERSTGINWLNELDDTLLQHKHAKAKYASFGWGDEGFYMDSYNNKFPGIGTCFNALFVPTPSLMHITFFDHGIKPGEDCHVLELRKEEYEKLCNSIRQSFSLGINKNTNRIASPGYWGNDYFFSAENNYHLLNTCNEWTNNCLKNAGIKASLHVSLADQIMKRF
jgi:uncharacterized protein (TIGR02117 family)